MERKFSKAVYLRGSVVPLLMTLPLEGQEGHYFVENIQMKNFFQIHLNFKVLPVLGT